MIPLWTTIFQFIEINQNTNNIYKMEMLKKNVLGVFMFHLLAPSLTVIQLS